MRTKPWLLALVLAVVSAACNAARTPRAAEPTGERQPSSNQSEPASSAESRFEPPEVVERRLENGIRVLIVERRDLPIVRVAFVVKRGAADASPGVASYAHSALLQKRSVPGMGVYTWFAHDAMGVAAVGVTRTFSGSNMPDESFAALGRIWRGPDVSAEVVEAERKRRQAASPKDSRDDDASLARLKHELLYPREHPYRHLAVDTQFTADVGADDVRRFFEEHVQPDQIVAIAVGDVARESFVDSVAYALGSWRGQAAARRPLPEPIAAPLEGARLTVIDHPGLGQSRIVLAARGVPWSSPDFEPLFLLNSVLGGSFLGRLNLNLREKHAYSYGSFSSVGLWRGAGPFTAEAIVSTEHTAAAMNQIVGELDRLRDEEIAAEELEVVKRAAIRRIPLMFRTLGSTLTALSELAIYDRPADDYGALPARIQRVTPADVRRVAREYLAPEKLRWLVVGDTSVMRPQMATLGPSFQNETR